MRVDSSLYVWQLFVVIVVTNASPVPSSPPSSPVRDCFVRDGSAPPALATAVSGDQRFGRAVDNDDDGSPSQSVSNIDRVATSSSCSSSLLVSVFVVVLLLPKRPAQARVPPRFRVGVVVILRREAAAFVALPILPPNEQRGDVDHRHQHCRDRHTPHCRRSGARCCRDDRAEENPFRQAEEGVVQVASGVGAVASVTLLLLRRRRRRR